ncbi:signal peptidase I [Streptomyces sp. ME02-8801-2C]|uniref:signal peptidase I n=1 Tax=Streptomyces sp. ME02-8801-2C TaxID=3028680 RepID=UPI0029B96F5C|nr:signal peptidase I [Streptomyces sp. ME02-8801-2C]MDX3453657.1 signal peptidase I [Streptomyces sp. ME02-8801-2C]
MPGKGRVLGVTAIVVGLVGVGLTLGSVMYGRGSYGASTISSQSMAPTYRPGDRIIFEQVDGGAVRRGEIVLFSAPDRYHSSGSVMQRVIGVGGDRVVCCTGEGSDARLSVNGKPLSEPYVNGGDADGVRRPYDVTVPEGRLFLLGDNRSDSLDSRFFASDHDGTVAESAVTGRMTDRTTIPVVIGSAVMAGAALAMVGLGLGIAAFVLRRRPSRAVPVAPQPVRPVQ